MMFSALLLMSMTLTPAYSAPETSAPDESTPALVWLEDYDATLLQAKAAGKPVLALFEGSDWCPYCIKLDKEVFDTTAFADYAGGNLVLLRLDFPSNNNQAASVRANNEALASRFGIEGFPTILLLNGEGDETARLGYVPGGADKFVVRVKALLLGDK